MNKILNILPVLFATLLLSFRLDAMEEIPELEAKSSLLHVVKWIQFRPAPEENLIEILPVEPHQEVPSLVTLCARRACGTMSSELCRMGESNTLNTLTAKINPDEREQLLKQPIRLYPILFDVDTRIESFEVHNFTRFFRHINLNQLNLSNLLQDANKRRVKAHIQAILHPLCTTVELNRNGLSADFFDFLKPLSQLTTLDLSHNFFSTLHTSHLSSLANLTDLNVENCRLRGIEGISVLTNLQKLNVAANELGEVDRMGVIATLPNLTCLNVAYNGTPQKRLAALAPLVRNGTTTIYFGPNQEDQHVIIGPDPELFYAVLEQYKR